MDDFFGNINKQVLPQFDLLQTAASHHRFVWFHPFGNGNGRSVRVLTYAMMIRQGFNIENGRLINPTAIFCRNRNKYYDFLGKADTGTEEGLLLWCEYVLQGLKEEIIKVERLADYSYLQKHILLPTILFAFKRDAITLKEKKTLEAALEKGVFQASDFAKAFPKNTVHTEISRTIKNLIRKEYIKPIAPKARKYTLNINSGMMLLGVMKAFDKEGFLPLENETDAL